MRKTLLSAVLFAAGVAAVAALPLAGRALRDGGTERCATDDVPISPRFRVRVVGADGRSRAFCCVDCAQQWLDVAPARPQAVFVTDEATLAEVPAQQATFVRSSVATCPVCGSHVHAFAAPADAARHAEAWRGRVLEGDERPLRTRP